MTTEMAIWTALPNGVADDGRLRLSVHISPRLRNDDPDVLQAHTLEELLFPGFAHWAARVNAPTEFEVQFLGGTTAHAHLEGPADPDLWDALLPSGTPVRPHRFQDHSKRNFHVFPVRPVLRFLEEAYGAAAAEGLELPSIDDPLGPLAAFDPLVGLTAFATDNPTFWEELGHRSGAADGQVIVEDTGGLGLSPGDEQARDNLFQAYRFYHRPGSQRPDFDVEYEEPSPNPHTFDFHEILSALADHPKLLRHLGLVLDLIVDIDAEELADEVVVPPQGVVRVVPHGPAAGPVAVCPGTSYDWEAPWFGARPKSDSRMRRGLLRLNPDFYDLFQVDVDGAALQSVGFATTLDAMRNPEWRSEAKETETGIPALRSAGLALARNRRAETLLEDLKVHSDRNAGVEDGAFVVFDAEDLVRGYRVDVFDQDSPDGPRWFSLHRRVVEHTIAAAEAPKPIKITDEAYLKATSATGENAEHPSASDDLYLHETVCGWDGWSLAAPRPGRRVVEPGQGDGGSTLARHDPGEGNPFPIISRANVERGTLPRLRVGHTYRLRVRTVDLAGNSLPFRSEDLEPVEPTLTSESQPYLRFEPVPSPTVLRRHLDTEGESLEHLVIRSDRGVGPAGYAQLPEVTEALGAAGSPHTYAGDSQRHLAPPKGSQQMAEQDGRFDAAFSPSPAAVTAALRVALREEGTFLDETIVDVTTGQKTIAQAPISVFPSTVTLPVARGAGLGDGAYAYYPDAKLSLPYLPDPFAIGVSLTGFDHTGAEVFHQFAAFAGGWPELVPFRLRLSEGPLGAELLDHVLEVRLPKAEVVWARLASVFPGDRLEDFAIWQWVDPARRALLEEGAVGGRHWMLTPYRTLRLTHAVQRPLRAPNMTNVTSSRAPGDTFATFHGPLANHSMSTGRLDVFGEWTEDIDVITDDEPRMRAFGSAVAHRAHAFGFEVRRGEDEADVFEHESRHQFGDTKYRCIRYHSMATSRFREFFPQPLTAVDANVQRLEAKDIKGLPQKALEHHILSSARPAAPEVLYVLPTFRWTRHDEGAHRTHIRRGKAVRVWLRRPWFSSGDGEQLAVILEPGVRLPPGWERISSFGRAALDVHEPRVGPEPFRRHRGEPTSAVRAGALLGRAPIAGMRVSPMPSPEQAHAMLRPYVTGWGGDPIWQSAIPAEPPTIRDFPARAGYRADLTLDELPAALRVVAVAHDVHFDHARRLWYCDIEIEPGDAYFPFVRLALARFQGRSVPGAHLSRIATTDFIQVVPDRRAEVILSENSAEIMVSGFSGRNLEPIMGNLMVDSEPPPNTTMRVTVEGRVAGIPGDLGWAPLAGDVELSAQTSGFHATWTGTVHVPPAAVEAGGIRLVITEAETYLRDAMAGDPGLSTSPRDFVRERIVYADTFEL